MKSFTRLAAVLVAGLLSLAANAAEGVWSESPAGLPYCRYDDVENGSPFLLGNYRMNVLTHLDGTYQLLSGEREWARYNADPARPDYGRNSASIANGRRPVELVGMNANHRKNKTKVYTGVGFTRYDYDLGGGLKCSRMISVMPSDKVNGGSPCLVITVTLSNTGGGTRNVDYEEVFSPYYVPVAEQMIPEADRAYSYPMATDITFRCLKGYFTPKEQKFMPYPSLEGGSRYDMVPQSVFLYAEDAFLVIADGQFKAVYSDLKVRSGKKRVLNIVVGLSTEKDVKTLAEGVLAQAVDGQFGLFEHLWKKRLPDFAGENSRSVRQEMYMSAYSLESSAVYSSYFDDTFIPCESGEVYHTGANISNRDHLERALPACHSNPELAKSVLRYVMKHSESDGRMYEGSTGYGYFPSSYSTGKDLQIHFFRLLSEYLRVTGDYAFLDENVIVKDGRYVSVLRMAEYFFAYLRDVVSLEADALELLRNQSLVSTCFPDFIAQLRESGRASDPFLKALESYSESAWDSYRKSSNSLLEHIGETPSSNPNSLSLLDYFMVK